MREAVSIVLGLKDKTLEYKLPSPAETTTTTEDDEEPPAWANLFACVGGPLLVWSAIVTGFVMSSRNNKS